MNNNYTIYALTVTLLLLIFTTTSSAQEPVVQQHFYFDIASKYELQTFQHSFEDAEVFSVSVLPAWYQNNFWISADATWYKSSTKIFLSDNRTGVVGDNIATFCKRYAAASAEVQASLLERYPNLVAVCNQLNAIKSTSVTESVSGWGDTALYIGYDYAFPAQANWYASVLLGYKWDNADELKSLGTGTQEVITGAALGLDATRSTLLLSIDYTSIVGGRLADFYDDFGLIALAANYRVFDGVWLGAELERQQAFAKYSSDTTRSSLKIRWSLSDDLDLTIKYSDYIGGEINADRQYSSVITLGF